MAVFALHRFIESFLLSENYAAMNGLCSYSIIMAPAHHPSTSMEVSILSDELADGYKDKVRSVTLENFLRSLINSCIGEYKAVFEKFADRYLDFDKLQPTSPSISPSKLRFQSCG